MVAYIFLLYHNMSIMLCGTYKVRPYEICRLRNISY
jgi:hypothetical protein